MKIQSVTPQIIKQTPDQFSYILNRLIDSVNLQEKTLTEVKRELSALEKKVEELEPTPVPPTPQGDWAQVLQFDAANMGSTPGYCLQNVMAGFGIAPYPGGSPGAFDDMLYNQAQGTLHEETYPPTSIAVPIYIRTGAEYQHVVAWDHGVVYSDGVVINNWVDYYGEQNIYGWGELCDKIRVVEPLS